MRSVPRCPRSVSLPPASPGRIKPLLSRSALYLAFTFALCAVSVRAQSSAAGSNWDHLKALPQHTRLHVSADKMRHTCYLLSVDDATLVCGRYTFPRAEVKSVKLTRYGVSYGGGAAIGAGIGAGVGLGVSAATDDAFFKNEKASFAGGGAAVGAVLGALIIGPLDLFRGPTVYRRQ